MEDEKILELYFQRSENAIAETKTKYGTYCGVIASNILNSHEETEECLNDTWLRTWNSIPPKRPEVLSLFLGRITRNLAINRKRTQAAEKRGSGQYSVCLDELSECVGDGDSAADDMELKNALNSFLDTLKPAPKRIFMLRYWYMYSMAEIAAESNMTESAVKMSVSRTREALREYLAKEGINV